VLVSGPVIYPLGVAIGSRIRGVTFSFHRVPCCDMRLTLERRSSKLIDNYQDN